MKRIILILTGLLFGLMGYSSSNSIFTVADSIPCNIKIEVDSYSGKKTIETDFVHFKGGLYKLLKDKDKIRFYLKLKSSIVLTIPEGEIIYIKLSDNSVVKFVNTSTDISDYSPYDDTYSNSFVFNLSGVQLEQLKTKKIIGIKCYINEYSFFYESAGENFKNNLNCLIKA